MFVAILAWLKGKKTFLKVQSGTGGELDMTCLDGGMFLFRESPDAMAALRACYTQATGAAYDEDDVTVLLEE